MAYFQEAIRLCPEFADAHSNLGNVLRESGDVDEAMSCYQVRGVGGRGCVCFRL